MTNPYLYNNAGKLQVFDMPVKLCTDFNDCPLTNCNCRKAIETAKAADIDVVNAELSVFSDSGLWRIRIQELQFISRLVKPCEYIRLPDGFEPVFGYQYHTSERYYGNKADWTDCTKAQFEAVKSMHGSRTRQVARIITKPVEKECIHQFEGEVIEGAERCFKCGDAKVDPIKEESQEEMFRELYNCIVLGGWKEASKRFTITRR